MHQLALGAYILILDFLFSFLEIFLSITTQFTFPHAFACILRHTRLRLFSLKPGLFCLPPSDIAICLNLIFMSQHFRTGCIYIIVISGLFTKYQFGAKLTPDSTTGYVMFRSLPAICSVAYIGPPTGTSRCTESALYKLTSKYQQMCMLPAICTF